MQEMRVGFINRAQVNGAEKQLALQEHPYILVARFSNERFIWTHHPKLGRIRQQAAVLAQHFAFETMRGSNLTAESYLGAGEQAGYSFVVVTGPKPSEQLDRDLQYSLTYHGRMVTLPGHIVSGIVNHTVTSIDGVESMTEPAQIPYRRDTRDLEKPRTKLSPRGEDRRKKKFYNRVSFRSAKEKRHRPPSETLSRLDKQVERWRRSINSDQPI